MSTEPQRLATKNVRVTPDVHARLQRLVDTTGCVTHNDAIELLMTPQTVRLVISPEMRARWEKHAKANGQSVPDFVIARTEAALVFGADPGALRRVHDMVYALTRAAGIVPEDHSTPGTHRQTISTRPEPRTP